MKTGNKLIYTVVAAVAVLAFAPLPCTAGPPAVTTSGGAAAGGMKMSMDRMPLESLVLRDDVIADMGLKVEPGTDGKTVLAALTPEQKKRLEQIGLQMRGANSLRIPDVQAQLGLSSEQSRRLEEISDESGREFMRIHESDLDAAGVRAAFEAQRKKSTDDSLAVLTDAQRTAWQAMNGEPFKQDMNLGISLSPGGVATKPVKEAPLLAAGTPAPDFTAQTVDGKTIKLSDYRGKVVVLDFWATWCGPCIASLPNLEETARRAKGQDVVFLALNVWDAQGEFKRWMSVNTGLTLQFARDPAGESHDTKNIAAFYNVNGIPTTYVIDRNGKVAGVPKSAAMSASTGGKRQPIPTTGTPDKALVELLGTQGIYVK